ncbi:MAG TPA: tRNA uridine-5-carboxymethylaminomethyl(34) synthesis enzyme MnmG [Chloroflexia bacterium]|nr:tRNA uridine-5-carboxymethylaminomethyl(34) synthesis enzyme MnmG [Chloroflexia bacterium]
MQKEGLPMQTGRGEEIYDVLVVGAGHAGCEAALASARMGHKTLLVTLNLDTVALMPCNPSVGGPAKGHVVRELDALGGEMGRNADRTAIQIRMLNVRKGPAVQVPRAQCDKKLYALSMKTVLETTPNLHLKQASVSGLILEPLNPTAGVEQIGPTLDHRPQAADTALNTPSSRLRVTGITTSTGRTYLASTVILTTGTFLRGRIVSGGFTTPAGRSGEAPSVRLSEVLGELSFPLMRLKTGTPPRIDARTIDFSLTEFQPGSPTPIYFSHERLEASIQEPLDTYPQAPDQKREWRRQMACYLVHTTPETHSIIRDSLHESPMFNGQIEGVGPRYCPSIEDKVYRFADKQSHQLFLEPEGWRTNEVYVQGCSTSLPEEVQWRLIRSIPALRNAELMRIGYAVEYDAVPPSEITPWLESKRVAGLFLAGQINGTSGYEEAAGQGIMAGINAALYCRRHSTTSRPARRAVSAPGSAGSQISSTITSALADIAANRPLILPRHLAYIGVMLDDLTAMEHREPYRLMTSRAEYRLLLRSDNADLRLISIGYALGMISDERMAALERKDEIIAGALARLAEGAITKPVAERLASSGYEPPEPGRHTTMIEYVRRQDTPYQAVGTLLPDLNMSDPLVDEAVQQTEIAAKYSGYIVKQEAEVARTRKLEDRTIPSGISYAELAGLKVEARQKLDRFKPRTVGQASRIAGVTPADIAVLLVHLKRISLPGEV